MMRSSSLATGEIPVYDSVTGATYWSLGRDVIPHKKSRRKLKDGYALLDSEYIDSITTLALAYLHSIHITHIGVNG